MTFLLFLRQGLSFLGSCCYLNSQRTQLVFTGERLYHTSSPRRFLCDNQETPGANFPGDHFGPLWTHTNRTCKLCITQILRPHQRSQSLSPEQNTQSLSSHTQTQLECQINPVRCHLSEYKEQYRHCIHTLRDSKCEQVLPTVYSNNQIASTPRSSTKEDDSTLFIQQLNTCQGYLIE